MALPFKVTAAPTDNALPSSRAPDWSVIAADANMSPLKTAFVPNVAALPTCQKTLQAFAPLIKST